MKKSVKLELNKYLAELNKKELEAEVKKLYSKFSNVKQYYEMELAQDTTAVLEEFKEQIRKEYFPKRGFGRARSGVSRKVVNDFKKIAVFKSDVIELILFRVEMMIDFTAEYGDIDEPFYNSLDSSFEEACKLINKEKLENHYREKCQKLLDSTYDFGWGVHEGFEYIFEKYFS